MTYGRILLLGLALLVTGGAVGGRWGGYLAVAAFVGAPLAALLYLSAHPAGVKDAEAKLAVVERLAEADEPPSRWERKQRLTREWRPSTPDQSAEVRRLVKEHRGALVRVLPDRTAEVLAAKKREQFRYVVAEDGRTTVAEASPTDRTPGRIALGGLAVFVLGWVIGTLADGTALEWAGVALVFAGFVVGALGLLASGSERTEHGALLRTNRGERWASLGYPED